MNAYEGHSTVDAGEPDAHGADPEASGEMAAISADRLEALGAALASRRDDWVSARAATGVEKRWKEDLDQYMGRDEATKQTASMMDSAEQGYPVTNKGAKPQRSTVFVNITRPKTNTAIARIQNMLLPTDDRNFGLKPSPSPDLTEQAKQDALKAAGIESGQAPQATGQAPQAPAMGAQAPVMAPGQPPQAPGAPAAPAGPPPPATVAAAIGTQWPTPSAQAQLDVAAGKARAMQDEIDDQLQECQFNREARMMLSDTGILGTGILKGPIVVNQRFKSWQPLVDPSGGPTVHVLEIKVEAKPASQRVDPWNFFPDPSCGDDIHAGMGVFEQVAYTSKQLRELSKQPGYLKDQIAKVLAEGPKAATHQRDGDSKPASSQAFECWEYWGEFEPEDLRSAGIDIDDGQTELISGCVILVNETVIKGFLNPLETGDLPYDVMNWESDPTSPFGYGVPYLVRSPQRVMNAAWRQLMDDAALSTGPQIVIDRTRVAPMDGKWEITGRKLWHALEAGTDVRTAFSMLEFANHSAQLEKVIELALKFVDLESAVPQLEQGEHANAPDTLGGMIIQQNSTNIVLSRLTKSFDDRITSRHIGRYVDWNMAYNEKPEIKGDFQVQARGTSALLVRDMQNQGLISLGQYMGNGIVAPYVNWEEWFKETLRAQKIDPTLIMKSDSQIAAIASQPPQATPEQIRANSMLAVAQTRAKAQTDVAGAKVQGEIAYVHTEQQISQQNAQARQHERQDELQLAMLRYAHETKQNLEQVRADLAKVSMQETTKRQLAAASMQLQANESHSNRTHDLHMQSASDTQQPIQ